MNHRKEIDAAFGKCVGVALGDDGPKARQRAYDKLWAAIEAYKDDCMKDAEYEASMRAFARDSK